MYTNTQKLLVFFFSPIIVKQVILYTLTLSWFSNGINVTFPLR